MVEHMWLPDYDDCPMNLQEEEELEMEGEDIPPSREAGEESGDPLLFLLRYHSRFSSVIGVRKATRVNPSLHLRRRRFSSAARLVFATEEAVHNRLPAHASFLCHEE
mmetsp:Transcript_20999/g.34643  ORF Transcript_20999/g.34643 Transcript_20999/m.34643 type:complete len:107 (-) Transcript_20999:349-669(-)